MTPHLQPPARRAMSRRLRTARRLRQVSLVGVVALVSGAPLVAHAAVDRSVPAVSSVVVADVPVSAPANVTAPALTSKSDRTETPDRTAAPDRTVTSERDALLEVGLAFLADSYDWDERGPRVEALQGVLGVATDGWYGASTRAAHLAALNWMGMPTDAVPMPPGPDAGAWAALRECESGGDYSITNRTGKYRGAYQFDRSTWNSVAGRNDPSLVGVDPAAAAPADQDAMAAALYAERGARPWPHCGRHLR